MFWFLTVVIILALLAVFLVFLLSILLGVPCLSTHRRQAQAAIRLAGLRPGVRFVDLGCGAGRVLFLAARQGAQATGYELNPFLCLLVWWRRIFCSERARVKIKFRSLFDADLSQADVVFCFLFSSYMGRLDKKFARELPAGAKVISYAFRLPGRTPDFSVEGIFVYTF